MLLPRIIPCLLVKDKALVKTVKFDHEKYVGDPLNAVKIFNEKEVDELILLDISATIENKEPDYRMIENIAMECRMPLCYGGGIKTVEQAKEIFSLGVEKIALSSAAIETQNLITAIAEQVGTQSVVVVLDVKKRLVGGGYDVYTHRGTRKRSIDFMTFLSQVESLGVGEIIINSIDRDGVMEGYDMNLASHVKTVINIPLTLLGGAGSLDDIGLLINKWRIIGASVGSLFVFKGKYKAVLINYPTHSEKNELIEKYFKDVPDYE